MKMPFDKLTESEKQAYRDGQESVINQLLADIAELEESRNKDSSYGKGQLFILRELVRRMCE